MSAAVGTAELKPGALVVWQTEPGMGHVGAGVVVELDANADQREAAKVYVKGEGYIRTDAVELDGPIVLVERMREIVAVPESSLMVYARSYDELMDGIRA